MADFKIFIVEDDPWYGEILQYHLKLNPDYEVVLFGNGKDCLNRLHEKPDLITIDYSLPDITGEKLFDKIRQVNDSVPIIVISGQDEITVAVDILKKGASDYLVKNNNTKDLLWNAIAKIREHQGLKKEVEQLKVELGKKYTNKLDIKGQSPKMEEVYARIEKASNSIINVSITGETGTGKEMVAKAIHYTGVRQKKPFVAVNMAAIPSELIESELFGHEKGSFTGAIGKKIGKFEEANGGTIFLDEIGEMDLHIQSKILRVLQERELVRIGGSEVIKLDIRLIVATHRNLAQEVEKNNFREDLYYRIVGLGIELPALRERGGDVLILAKHFLDEAVAQNGLKPLQLTDEAKNKLLSYHFPGNIRELKSIIELAAVMCNGSEIFGSDISFPESFKAKNMVTTDKTLKEHSIQIVQTYLDKYNKDITKTAEMLDIGKSTIYKMIKDKEIFV